MSLPELIQSWTISWCRWPAPWARSSSGWSARSLCSRTSTSTSRRSVAGLGIGGVAVALAAQDSIKNLLGGATILADKPFQVGDWVVIGQYEGTVEQVGFRSTRIRTFADSLITMPNARITDTEVNNMGRRSWRRYSTTLGLAYYTDPDRIQAFVEGVRAIVLANPKMRHDYYIVEFITFADSSLNIMVYTFIEAADWNEEMRTRHIFNLDILRLAERLAVDFAFPTQTLHVAETPGRSQQLPPQRSRDELGATVDDFAPRRLVRSALRPADHARLRQRLSGYCKLAPTDLASRR